MADVLLVGITLTQDYGSLPAIDNTDFSDFTNWSVLFGTPNSSSSSNINYDSFPGPTSNSSKILSATLAPVTIEYGANFRVSLTIDPSSPSNFYIVPYFQGVALPVAAWSGQQQINVLTAVDFDFNSGGYTFDQIALYSYSGGGAITIDVSLGTITGLDSSDYTDFNTGDRILVYFTGTVYKVYREDNPGGSLTEIFAGPNLGDVDAVNNTTGLIPNGTRSQYQYCDGTTLVHFLFDNSSPDYPYISRYDFPNNSACSVDEIITCDTHFTTQPVIVPASSQFLSDGSVTVTAVSSHGDVKYSQFPPTQAEGQYNNIGFANLGGFFGGLAAGTYTFYAVDIWNCYSSITAVVPSEEIATYGTKYRIQYYDTQTHVQTICDIEERGFTGDIIQVEGTGDPVVIQKNNGELNNKFDIIRPTFATFNINSSEHFQYLGLFSQDDRKYKMNYTHGSTTWKGFLAPSTYTESYSPSKNYPINLKFGDNLAAVSEFDFLDESGNRVINSYSLLHIISIILKKVDLKLDILSGINKFAAGMSTGSTDDPLEQTFIECLCFYDDNGNPEKCDEVLKAILAPFGAYIIQNNSAWNILEVDGQTAPYAYRKYDYTGAYLSNGTINPILLIDKPYVTLQNVLFANSDHVLEIIPAYGKITITHILKPRVSIFPPSLDQGWQINSSAGGYGIPYEVKDSLNKGIQFGNLGTGLMFFYSPFFTIKSTNDSVVISFAVLYQFARYASFTDPSSGITFNPQNVPDPPWTRIEWRLLLKAGGQDFYYSEIAGWGVLTVVGTSVSSVATPTSHPTSRTLTTQTGLTLYPGTIVTLQSGSVYFRATVTTYNTLTGSLVVSSFLNVGSGTFSSWDIYTNLDYSSNFIFFENGNSDFQNFEKKVNLPVFTSQTEISLQLQMVFHSSYSKDFTDLTSLRAIPAGVYKTGFKIMGTDPADVNYLRWYKLREGTDADNGTSIIRSTDFNSTTNAVVWDSDGYDAYRYVNQIAAIFLKELFVKFLPGGIAPVESETLTFTNNPNYKERLDIELTTGDWLSEVNAELYTNVFKDSSGVPTGGWARTDTAEVGRVQDLLLKSLGNQYNKPTWRLSGSWMAPGIEFTSIIKHTINANAFSITNPENPNGAGWSLSGSGQTWANGAGYCYVDFDPTHTGNSLYVKQPNDLSAGARIRLDFSLRRVNSDGTRIDKFVCVIFRGSLIIQKVTLSDGLSYDTDIFKQVAFNLDGDGNSIGFYIENISGTGTCQYQVDYFRGNGVASVRYYFPNQISRSDKYNLYNAEMIQLIPAVASTNPAIDDTGGGNTGGDDNGGGVSGKAFSYGFSNGFS